jgi:uracil-DNA glycosylase
MDNDRSSFGRKPGDRLIVLLQAHPQQTAQRTAALAAYYHRHVLTDDTFLCQHCAACKASYTNKDGRYSAGQLNAPGTHYDLIADGKPLRIVVVGQESGTGLAHTTMADRRAALAQTAAEQRFVAEAGYTARTQHMKGITNVLRLLLGKELGTNYVDEFVTLADGSAVHLLHCFALVNYLLCSAHSTKRSKRGESTTTMRRNCNEHFRATLEILEPTVVIVEGKAMWPHARRAFDTIEAIEGLIFRATLGARKMVVLSFTHPSSMHPHNWGINANTPYLLETVVPAIERLRVLLESDRGTAE